LNKTCLLLGSGSDIGQAIVYTFARQGFDLLLAARTPDDYQQRLAADLNLRHGVAVRCLAFDGEDLAAHPAFVAGLGVVPTVVVSVFGYLGDHARATTDAAECGRILAANYTGHVSLLNLLAAPMRERGHGTIIGISSVAGERGRQSNYLYGSAKAGFTAYLSGLRNALFASGVQVITIKPGFVRTKMLAGLATPAPLTAQPAEVAEAVWQACRRQRNVVYVPAVWRYIMLGIRLVPEPLFKRLKL
jgi:decaprenylphospho-beta-D-erythro-pentofuranosid-2-ulose 2-reductase